MQIRNVPHFGHEAVFKHILSQFDCLYLNPIYGIKKNDFSNKFISKALNFVKKNLIILNLIQYGQIFIMQVHVKQFTIC